MGDPPILWHAHRRHAPGAGRGSGRSRGCGADPGADRKPHGNRILFLRWTCGGDFRNLPQEPPRGAAKVWCNHRLKSVLASSTAAPQSCQRGLRAVGRRDRHPDRFARAGPDAADPAGGRAAQRAVRSAARHPVLCLRPRAAADARRPGYIREWRIPRREKPAPRRGGPVVAGSWNVHESLARTSQSRSSDRPNRRAMAFARPFDPVVPAALPGRG